MTAQLHDDYFFFTKQRTDSYQFVINCTGKYTYNESSFVSQLEHGSSYYTRVQEVISAHNNRQTSGDFACGVLTDQVNSIATKHRQLELIGGRLHPFQQEQKR
jgi:hypothetical protein